MSKGTVRVLEYVLATAAVMTLAVLAGAHVPVWMWSGLALLALGTIGLWVDDLRQRRNDEIGLRPRPTR